MDPKNARSVAELAQCQLPLPDALIRQILEVTRSQTDEYQGFKAICEVLHNVSADESDQEFFINPCGPSAFHRDLVDTLTTRLKFMVTGGRDLADVEARRIEAQQARADFNNRAQRGVMDVAKYFTDLAQRRPLRQPAPKQPSDAFDLAGFEVTSSRSGDKVDLLDTDIPQFVLPTFRVTRGMTNFVHWKSNKALQLAATDISPEATTRFYLNPRYLSAPKVFGEIIDRANAAGLAIDGKLFHRAQQAIDYVGSNRAPQSSRGDGILLYADAHNVDATLQIVRDVQKQFFAAFSDRTVVNSALTIGDGIGVGSEVRALRKDGKDHSLTTRIGELFAEVAATTHHMQAISPVDDVVRFRAVLDRQAPLHGMNANNLALGAPTVGTSRDSLA